jgi:hypothetical protein
LLASRRDRFGKQDDGANDFVVVLQRVGKEEFLYSSITLCT